MAKKPATRRTSIFLGERNAPLFNRLMAKALDSLIIVAMYFLGQAVWLPLGLLCAMVFCALQDGMWVGQSIGKRIVGLRVIEDNRGLPCNFKNSVLRNLPFILAIPLAAMPLLWVVLVLMALPILIVETYLVVALESGTRLGDILGNTLVVEYLDSGMQEFQ